MQVRLRRAEGGLLDVIVVHRMVHGLPRARETGCDKGEILALVADEARKAESVREQQRRVKPLGPGA